MQNESVDIINFRQERDFGEIISSTFNFFKQEFKNFQKPLLYVFAPCFLLVTLLYNMLISQFSIGLFSSLSLYRDFSDVGGKYLLLLIPVIFIMAFVILMFQFYFYAYIKNYIDNKGIVDLIAVRKIAISKILPGIGYSFVTGLLIIVATFFLIIPGIYLGIASLLTVAAIFYDDSGKFPMFRSIELIRGKWWLTFGLLFVMGVIVYSLVAFLNIPIMIITFTDTFNKLNGSKNFGSNYTGFPLYYYIYQAITSTIGELLQIVTVFMLSFHYFSLVEKKEMTTLINRVAGLGE